MRRVVVTGMGIVSSIGNSLQEVTDSLYHAKSGIELVEEYRQLGFRSHVAGTIKLNLEEVLDRRTRRFMGGAAAYTFLAMQQAIEDAGLQPNEVSNELTGLVGFLFLPAQHHLASGFARHTICTAVSSPIIQSPAIESRKPYTIECWISIGHGN